MNPEILLRELQQSALEQLLSVNAEEWRAEAIDMDQYLNEFGDRTPVQLRAEVAALRTRLS